MFGQLPDGRIKIMYRCNGLFNDIRGYGSRGNSSDFQEKKGCQVKMKSSDIFLKKNKPEMLFRPKNARHPIRKSNM